MPKSRSAIKTQLCYNLFIHVVTVEMQAKNLFYTIICISERANQSVQWG